MVLFLISPGKVEGKRRRNNTLTVEYLFVYASSGRRSLQRALKSSEIGRLTLEQGGYVLVQYWKLI